VYGERFEAEHGADLGAGFKINIKKFSIGASLDNILAVSEQTTRKLNAGFAFNILEIFNPAVDFSADLDKLRYDFNFGFQAFMLNRHLILRGGFAGGDLFKSPAITYGTTIRLHRFYLSYGGSYSFNLESIGNHYISLGLFFNTVSRQG